MAVNKIVYGSSVLIDLTTDTVSEDKLLSGFTAHDKSGAVIHGKCDYDVNSGDGTAAVAELLLGKTAYARGTKLVGTMPNNGAASGEIATVNGEYTIPLGFHDGSGKVGISAVERAKLIKANIKAGITILGVQGEYGGEEVTAHDKTVVPSTAEQTVLPDEGYDYLSSVTVAAIPYTEMENSAGGTTVTIAAAA